MIECYDGSECVDFDKICDYEPHCADGSDEFMCTEENLLNLIHGISPAIANAEVEAADAARLFDEAEAAFANEGCVIASTVDPANQIRGSGDIKPDVEEPATAPPPIVTSPECLHLREILDRMTQAADRAARHETFAKAAFKVAWRLLDQFEEGPSTTTVSTTTTTLFVIPAASVKEPMHTGSLFAILLSVTIVLVILITGLQTVRKKQQEADLDAYRNRSSEERGVENPLYEAPVAEAETSDENYLTVGAVGGDESGMESDDDNGEN